MAVDVSNFGSGLLHYAQGLIDAHSVARSAVPRFQNKFLQYIK